MEFKVSDDLVTTNPEKSVIMNRRTGEQYLLNKQTLQFLGLFTNPQTIEEVVVSFKIEEQKTVQQFIDNLIKNELLVESVNDAITPSFIRPLPISRLEKPSNTFFSVPYKALDALPDNAIVFLGFPYDQGTTGLPGTRFGPEQLRQLTSSNFDFHADIFTGKSKGWFSQFHGTQKVQNCDLFDIGDILINIGENPEAIFQKLRQVLADIIVTNSFPIVIGGDHSLSYSILSAHHDIHKRPCALIHFDAHSDIGGYCPDISHNHGNVFSRALHEGICNEIHQIGLRTTFDSNLIGVSTYSMDSLNNSFDKIISNLNPETPYHLSIDIDVLDPIYTPGTGTPVPNGMSVTALLDFITTITTKCKIVFLDIVEINPMVDVNKITLLTASQILFHVLTCMF